MQTTKSAADDAAFQIERGVAIPKGHASRNAKYPWRQMEVGDSFFVGGITRNHINALARYQALAHGQKFTTRVVEGGIRVWRIA